MFARRSQLLGQPGQDGENDCGFFVFSGVQYVPGDASGLHRAAQGRPAGLALRPAHTAAEEDGG